MPLAQYSLYRVWLIKIIRFLDFDSKLFKTLLSRFLLLCTPRTIITSEHILLRLCTASWSNRFIYLFPFATFLWRLATFLRFCSSRRLFLFVLFSCFLCILTGFRLFFALRSNYLSVRVSLRYKTEATLFLLLFVFVFYYRSLLCFVLVLMRTDILLKKH